MAPFRRVEDLKGWVVLPDGSTRVLSKEGIIRASASNAAGYYDDGLVLITRPAGLRPGAVVAYEYDVQEEGWTGLFQNFAVQTQQPVKFARFSVSVPSGWRLHRAVSGGIDFEQVGDRYVWTARDLPYQPVEPQMPPWYAVSRLVAVAIQSPSDPQGARFADWPSVARWYEEMSRAQAIPDPKIAEQTQRLTQGKETPGEKLLAIAAFVQNEIRYVAVEIGKERWQPRPSPTTFYNRYGDCKDKTALMRAMLQAIGIPSASVLACVGPPVQRALPSPFQFNHCIVGIPLQGIPGLPPRPAASANGWLFFDPTDPSTPLGHLPRPLPDSYVMLAAQADSVLCRLPAPSPESNRRRYRAEARLAEDGSFAAQVTVEDFGTWAFGSRHQREITPVDKQVDAWRKLMSQTVPAPVISDYRTGAEGDSAWASFQIRSDRYATQAGPLHLLKPDFFCAPEPPALTSDHRHHPIWYGPAMQVETEVVWRLPAGWGAEIDPPRIESSCDAAGLSCEISLSGGTLRFVSEVRQTGRQLPPETYAAARRFSRDLSAVKGLTLVLKKP